MTLISKNKKHINKIKKIAFVDFDGTLVKSNVVKASMWFLFGLPNSPAKFIRIILFTLISPILLSMFSLNIKNFDSKEASKLMYFFLFNGISYKDAMYSVDKFSYKFEHFINKKVIDMLKNKDVYIVSGNSHVFIGKYCSKYGYNYITSTFGFDKNQQKYTADNMDICLGKRKAEHALAIMEKYKKAGYKIETYAFGNSIDDIEMLKVVDNAFAINPYKNMAKELIKNPQIKIIRC